MRSPRGRRRDDVVTYRVRVDLEGTDPPLWRGLELASQTERDLCPFDVDEGDTGIPAAHVRLDEVLAEPGDRLFYSHDYGDNWEHVIVLEAVLPVAPGSGLAVCVGGSRRGPAEDCGGTDTYQLVEAATDPGNGQAAAAAAELAEIFGSDIDIEVMVGMDYDLDEINGALEVDGGAARHPAASVRPRPLDLSVLPPPVADLLDAVRTSTDRRTLRRLIDCADLTAQVLIDATVAAAMVRPYAWLTSFSAFHSAWSTHAGAPADRRARVRAGKLPCRQAKPGGSHLRPGSTTDLAGRPQPSLKTACRRMASG